MDILRFIKQNFYKILGVVIILIVSLLIIDKLVFRLTHTTPALSNIATSSVSIKLSFSQPISSVGGITINNRKISDVFLDQGNIIIPLSSLVLVAETNYQLLVSDIQSAWFNNRIDKLSKTLTVKYIDFNQLSSDERKAQVDNSNSGQIDDPFLTNSFPIIDKDYRYQIEATNLGDRKNISLYVTFFDEVPNYDQGGKVNQLSNSVAEEYRKDVFKTIREYKGDPDKYIITYSNLYLNSKYEPHIHSD